MTDANPSPTSQASGLGATETKIRGGGVGNAAPALTALEETLDTPSEEVTREPSALSSTYDSTPAVGEVMMERAASLRKRFFVALPLGTAVMVLSMVPALQFPGWQWVVAALTVPVITWCAWPFHKAAFAAARHGSTTMDTLVSMGVIASATWSYWALFFGGAGHIGMKMDMSLIPRLTPSGHAELYFEASSMIIVFLLGGRWAEARTRYRAGDALRKLLDLGAKEATLVTTNADGQRVEEVIPARSLNVGDLFLVRPGEKIATDGVILEGASAIDNSLLTGESVPEDVGPDDDVTGGTMNTWGSLLAQATRVGEETTLAQIGRMVTEAQATKAPVQRLADKVSAVFVPVIISVALITLIAWVLLGHPLQAAFTAAVSVLVVACPCALGLATPTALLVGSGRASQLGILIRNAEVLEQTRTIDTAVLDKTGTVTTGELSVTDVVPAKVDATAAGQEEGLLALAASVEQASEHPLARAIHKAAKQKGLPLPTVEHFANHAGKGVSGVLVTDGGKSGILVGGSRWLSGHGVHLNPQLAELQSEFESSGATVIAVVKVPAAQFAISHDADAAGTVSSSLFEGALPGEGEGGPLTKITMSVAGMTCASCVGRVERKLRKLPGVDPSVNLATETATITLDGDYTGADLEEVVNAAGFEGHILNTEDLRAVDTNQPEEDPHGSAGSFETRELPEELQGAEVLGLLVLRDTLKRDAASAITGLKELGIEPVLMSGDNRAAAEHVAGLVGIDRVFSEVLPEQKRDEVAALQDEGRTVAMIGDGVNDAAAMAQASKHGLGMAMGSGTDVAMEVADMTLVNSDLESAPRAIRISRKTLRVIKGNLFWAFFYNILAVPLAVMGLLNPMIAAAAMASSSIFVVANSLRLRTAG